MYKQLTILLLIAAAMCPPGLRAEVKTDALIRVRVTGQSFDFFHPWAKKSPSTREGLGVIISGSRILVTARLVKDATMVELENIVTRDKTSASVAHVDYAANLALIVPDDASFLAGVEPWEIHPISAIGDAVQSIQFEDNGRAIVTEGEIKAIDLANYPFDIASLLAYRVEISLARDVSSYTLPMTFENRLIGIVMTYSRNDREAGIIPAPVILRFLEDLEDGDYAGFPRAGFGFSSLEDPQARRYTGLDGDSDEGVYLTFVIPGSPIDRAGIKKGDVLLGIDDFSLDRFGEYEDPEFGPQSVAHLTTTRAKAGDTVVFHILRDGKPLDVDVTLEPIPFEDFPVVPVILDKAPQFIIVGGLVLQELSVSYLQEWGGKWATKSPRRLYWYQQHQWEMFKPGERVVLLSQVLASEGNIGYDRLRFLRVTEINNIKLNQLADVEPALKSPVKGFHKISFDEHPTEIYLNADTLDAENARIKDRYQLPRLKRINGEH